LARFAEEECRCLLVVAVLFSEKGYELRRRTQIDQANVR